MISSTLNTTNLPTSLPIPLGLHDKSLPPRNGGSAGERGGGDLDGSEPTSPTKKASKKRIPAAVDLVDENHSPQQKKPRASNNDHTASPSRRSHSPPPSLGASATAAQKSNDIRSFGDPISWASTPSPPSPPSRSSSTIPIITLEGCKSCSINMPVPTDKKYASRKSTILTTDIANRILPTVDNKAFWEIRDLLGTISHNEDTRGGEDGQKRPFPTHVNFFLNGELVMRLPPQSIETRRYIERVFPQYRRHQTTSGIGKELRRYYRPGDRYSGEEWNGLRLEYVESHLWYGEIGFVGDGEALLSAHANQRMNALLASPHFSGFPGQEFTTGDIQQLQAIASTRTFARLRSFSAAQMSLFNRLVQVSRQLRVDQTRSNMPTDLVAQNDTRESASAEEVTMRFAEVLAASDFSVNAFLSTAKSSMERFAMWKNVDKLRTHCLHEYHQNWGTAPQHYCIAFWGLCPAGQKDRLNDELLALTICMRRVFSAKSTRELEDLYVGIYWNAMKLRQESFAASIVHEHLPSAHQDISTTIIGFVTTSEIPSPPKCIRPGCNNIAAPDPQRRSGKYDDITCNDTACASTCGWHKGGVRCTEPRQMGRIYCRGTWCKGLNKCMSKVFDAEKRARVASGEIFA